MVSGPLKILHIFPFFVYLRYLPNNHKQLIFTSIVILVPSPAPVVGDKSLKTQSQVSFVSVEAMEVDPASAAVTSPVKRNHELRQL